MLVISTNPTKRTDSGKLERSMVLVKLSIYFYWAKARSSEIFDLAASCCFLVWSVGYGVGVGVTPGTAVAVGVGVSISVGVGVLDVAGVVAVAVGEAIKGVK